MWAQIEEKDCPCKGSGWALQADWEECPIHFYGQLHPQSRDLLLDDPPRLKEEERKSQLRWRIVSREIEIVTLQSRIDKLKLECKKMQSELVSRTATIKMEAVKPEPNWDEMWEDI